MKKAVSDTPYKHVILRDDGVPTIAGTRMRVEILVLEHHEYGWSPAELQFQHPHLSMGQIHSALSYYWDHKAEMDKEIKEGLEHIDNLRRLNEPHQQKLKSRLKERPVQRI